MKALGLPQSSPHLANYTKQKSVCSSERQPGRLHPPRTLLAGSRINQPPKFLGLLAHSSSSSVASKGSSHSVQASSSEPQRHAVLHDFCMIIPYGVIITAAGVVSLFFGSGWSGIALAASGMSELWLTRCSLKQWRAGASSKPYTAASAVGAGGLAFHFHRNVQRGLTRIPNVILLVISLAACAFLLYNILAGGNPPKEDPAVTAQDAAAFRGNM